MGIPVYGDQRLNMFGTVSAGIGVLLELKNVTIDSLTWAVKEFIENRRYFLKKLKGYGFKELSSYIQSSNTCLKVG